MEQSRWEDRVPLLLDDILSCAASAVPNRVAATFRDRRQTFGQLRAQANRLANALASLGVRPGDRVVYWADLSLDEPAVMFALGRLGAVFAPLNPAYSAAETQVMLEYLTPRLLVVDPAHADAGGDLARSLGVPVATLGGHDGHGPGASLDQLCAAASESVDHLPAGDEHAVAHIFATSGSTGTPKGVMVSQRATWMRSFIGAGADVTTGGRGQLVTFPLFHMAGWTFALNAWSAHQPAHFVTRADGDELLSELDRHDAAAVYCIPAVWRRILDARGDNRGKSLDWAMVGTSLVELDLVEQIRARFPHARTTVSYGSTEAGGSLRLGDADLFRKPGSVGLPVPGLRAKVAPHGELLLRGETLMSGYYDLREETEQALAGGWYHTGDLVEQDDEGYFWIVGRRKEMIRSGGEWVTPLEVESALAGFPGLADLAVVGHPDPDWGEVVCAVVVVAAGYAPPTVADLRRHLAGRLAAFKHPRRVLVVDHIPRTAATGQPQRTALAGAEAVE